MFHLFKSFQSPQDFLKLPLSRELQGDYNQKNLLIFDDNLNAMQNLLQNQAKSFKNSIDLIYIDPPFATNNTFRLGSTMSASLDSKIAYKDKFNLESYLEFLYYRLILIKELMSEKGVCIYTLMIRWDTMSKSYVMRFLEGSILSMILRALNVILKTLNAKPMGISKIESYFM